VRISGYNDAGVKESWFSRISDCSLWDIKSHK